MFIHRSPENLQIINKSKRVRLFSFSATNPPWPFSNLNLLIRPLISGPKTAALIWSAPLVETAKESAVAFNPLTSNPGNSRPLECMANFSEPLPIFSEALFTPSAKISPRPSLCAIFGMISINASWFPKVKFIPSASFDLSILFSKHSIAQAITTPVLITSIPRVSQSSPAFTIAGKYHIPQFVPSAYIPWYSIL